MAKVIDSPGGFLNGKVGGLVYYQIDGKTYARKAPSKQSKSQKEKVSPLKKLSQDKMGKTQKYLKVLSKVIAFGFQELKDGARRPYHACVSYTKSHCFIQEKTDFYIDPALFKISRGSLMPPDEAKAEKTENGILFTWKNNAWRSSAKPWDQALIVLHNPEKDIVEWKLMGNTRESESQFIPLSVHLLQANWHVYLAFSQEHSRSGKRMLSDSVYLGWL